MLQAHHNGRAPLDPNSPTARADVSLRVEHLDWLDKKAVSWGYNRNQSIRSIYNEWRQLEKPALPSIKRTHKSKVITLTAPRVLLDEISRDAHTNKQMRAGFVRSIIAWGMQHEAITA